MEANGVNYYKGVLLCSRPNESPSITKVKQFCARVVPQEKLGLVPVKQFDQKHTRKRVLPVLNNHKKWLEKFKHDLKEKKVVEEAEKEKEIQRLEKIKQEGIKQLEKWKNPENVQTKVQTQKPSEINNISKPTAEKKHKKKEKPAWARTQKQNEKKEDEEIDELLDFFSEEKETELKGMLSDEEVKKIVVDLKAKIQKLKQKQGWKDEQLQRLKEKDQRQENKQSDEDKDDVLSRISKHSAAQSVTSQKTAERVEKLEKKKQQKQWDNISKTDKKSMASLDDQIAKNIADEILRNYPNLKHHSNQSIRKLLEKQAHDELKA